ncbi:MAG: SsrA-binding protein SmpB [Chloroflexi bacterium]|nr:SsrA-binding protein SmpB [Chloroflexota bacterium]
MAKEKGEVKTVALNRKARHDYFIAETLEAGMSLTGAEIKSIRAGRVNLRDSYVIIKGREAWLVGTHISPYPQARNKPDPKRTRRLLLNRKEINRLAGQVKQKGFTIIPLRLYLKDSWAKLEIGLARGKREYDKRAAIAEREAKLEIEKGLAEKRKRRSR